MDNSKHLDTEIAFSHVARVRKDFERLQSGMSFVNEKERLQKL